MEHSAAPQTPAQQARIEDAVAAHYRRPGLETAILDGVLALGLDPEHLDSEVLSGADEFHIGGAEAARDVASAAGIGPGSRVLDVGSGIGGPARLFARHFGATVHGIDLTPEFVRIAESLTRRTGLADRVSFSQGSALALSFRAEFDAATMLHVGMNIKDKAAVFAGVFRALKPGGVFAVYDVMRTSEGEPDFPLPWAADPATSFVQTPQYYAALLREAGFSVEPGRNRGSFAVDFIERPPTGAFGPVLQRVAGPEGPVRMSNLLAACRAGILAPVEIFGRR